MKIRYLLIPLILGIACEKQAKQQIQQSEYHASIFIYNHDGERYSIQDTTSYYNPYSTFHKASEMMDLEKELKQKHALSAILKRADKTDLREDNVIY